MWKTDLDDTLEGLKEELQTWINDNPGDDEPNDTIFELSDSGVPIYTGDIIQYALENLDFAVNEPELGPAFDGSPTPTNIIAANIFEYLEAELWDYFNDHKDDYLDNEEEIEE